MIYMQSRIIHVSVPRKKMLFLILLITLFSLSGSLCKSQTEVVNTSFKVGVILDSESLIGSVGLTSLSLAIADFYSTNTNYTTKLELHLRNSKGHVIDAAAIGIGHLPFLCMFFQFSFKYCQMIFSILFTCLCLFVLEL